jgi:hypothetical protein
MGQTPWNPALRDRLRRPLALRGQGAIRATNFNWETTATPKTREGDLLSACQARQGKLPRYNRPGSPLHTPQDCITDLRARVSPR